MKRIRAFGIFLVALLWLGLCAWAWVRRPDDISLSERRKLAQFPQFSSESLLNGSFTAGFGEYTMDQFPMRDGFRTLKSIFSQNILRQKDNNGIYLHDDYAAQIQYPLDTASIAHANQRISRIYEKYLAGTDCEIYLSIIPDKHYFLAESGQYPSLDYAQLTNLVTNSARWADYINLFGTLTIDDYYRTDTHWRQENLLPVADILCDALDIDAASAQNFRTEAIDVPFYGVYRGQAALPMAAETIYTLRNDVLDGCRVFNYETNSYAEIYDKTKLTSRDLYDIFLSGAIALQRIENPAATTDRALIVFRDSFGSSLIPLLVHGYKTVTVVDIRYVSPEILGNFIEFSDQDVLIIYSTILLNNSAAIK